MTIGWPATWWSVRVELLGGGKAGAVWPRPGRVFAVSIRHSFCAFAEAIDQAFARWDRSHLREFRLPDDRSVTEFRHHDDIDDLDPVGDLDADAWALGAVLKIGDEFGYTFDAGDGWRHHCSIESEIEDPFAGLGAVPPRPLPIWGWGSIPDPYGLLFDGDDGHAPIPAPPHEPWPCADPPEPSIVVESVPGRYTRTLRCSPA
ncbi:IS1096 element passenger TnpR family protein [Couchioplanes azureus]|uniref:IS1096 element passenger TnpR family protein n=1 Tax=Couchioplanes caeruleus TaxID=56438 RepID=UPI001671614F|nr:hypothetical protein [Couchioplanes caeruleus]GGQ42882.1 hypothetical protein GCM10010166_08860 [Couchioplanes caeruleus subsp. azureus]